MGLRFTRCLSLIPGLRLNLYKSDASLSIGHRGAWYTIGPRGRRVTLGLPGTGLYWTETPPARPVHYAHRAPFVVAAVIALGLIGMLAGVLQ